MKLIAILGVLFALATDAPQAHAAPKEKKVLFLCTGNFYRSRFAQAVFNETPPKGWTAVSRGLDANKPRKTPVSPLVTAELDRRHIPLTRVDGRPTQITQEDVDQADVIVLLDGAEHAPLLKKLFPALSLDKVKSWAVQDIDKTPAPDAFAAIAANIAQLIKDLK